MFERVIFLVTIYFLIGAVAVFRITTKNPFGKRELWTKFTFYFLIVYTLLLSVNFLTSYFYLFSLGIIITGYCEIMRVWLRSTAGFLFLSVALIVYTLLASCFVQFCYSEDRTRLLWLYMLVLTFDGFSQIGGQLLGKRKIAVNISPNKTREGCVSGLVMTGFTAYILQHSFSENYLTWLYILLVLMVCLFACTSDLLASYYKRKTGVKDYSSLIPGHGGILDRFDSFIGAAAGYYVTLFLFG